MIKGKGGKFGDTLVEVTLAIGIFSMVAIAAVSVISASTSGAQNILENTLTREQIDSQAEALRFIQAAYTAEGERDQDNLTKYGLLWQAISSHAISLEGVDAVSDDIKNNILNYNPTTCSELYSNDAAASIVKQNAFLININALGSDINKDTVSSVVVPAKNGTSLSSKFRSATTYPRIVYGAADSINDPLYDPSTATNLYAAEGLFVVAVKDTSGTLIVSDDTGNIGSISAYIDFYIRSCWFATGSERPTTISTVIRLYNPDTVSVNKYDRKGVIVKYEKGGDDVTGTMPSQYILSGTSASPLTNTYTRPGYAFMGWTATDSNGTVIETYNVDRSDGSYDKVYTASTGLTENQTVTMTAIWKREYTITYYDTDGKTMLATFSELSFSENYTFYINDQINPTAPPVSQTGNEMVLLGWSENKNGSGTLYNNTGENNASTRVVATAPDHQNISLYPVWRQIITFVNVPWSDFGNSGGYCKISKTNNGIELRGHRRQAVNCGVEFSVGKDDTFELSADLNTQGIFTHPQGLVAISVGPLVAIITTGGSGLMIYYGYLPLTGAVTSSDIYQATNYTRLSSKTIHNGGTATIVLTKYGDVYTMAVNGDEAKIEIRQNNNGTYNVYKSDGQVLASNRSTSELNNIKVKYTMIHTSHNCSIIFNAKLYNIRMTTAEVYYDTN